MTVAIGFHCTDGLVLAADSELSSSTVKFSGTKSWTYRYPKGGAMPLKMQVAVVGAGDAAFLQYASERIDGALEDYVDTTKKPLAMTAVNAVIQGVVNDIHHTHLYPISQQPHERPAIELIVGVWLASGRLRLMKTHLTAIGKVWNYEAAGSGSDLANFVIRRFYGGRVAISQAVFIASEALKHAKDYVPGCGGQTNVIVMYQHGLVGTIHPETIQKHEEFLKVFDEAVAPVFLGGSDLAVSNHDFHKRVDTLSERLKSVRKIEEIKDLNTRVEADVKVPVPAGNVGFVSSPPTPLLDSVAQPQPEVQPVRTRPKRGRKSRPPSRA